MTVLEKVIAECGNFNANAVTRLVERLVAEEREACARLAEDMGWMCEQRLYRGLNYNAWDVAAAIRKRGK